MRSSACLRFVLVMVVAFALPCGLALGAGGAELVIQNPITMTGKPVTVIAIPTFGIAGDSGGVSPSLLRDVIYNDLEIFSDFQRVPNQSFVEEAQRRDAAANAVDMAGWRQVSANFVLKGQFSVSGGTITADCLLYDVDGKRQLFGTAGLRYDRFPLSNPRKLAHRISDDIVKAVFNDIGIANTQIAYVSARASASAKEIYVMDADGQNQRRLTFDNTLVVAPCWGKNAGEIYFTSFRDRWPDLCGVQLASPRVWYISKRYPGNFSPDWCPKTERIVFTLCKDGNSEVYSVGRSGDESTLRRLTRSSALESSPSWSPDGSQIVYASDATGAINIYVMNADGSNQRRLTFQGSYNVSPSWSPIGDKIAYCARDRSVFDIYVMNADGSGVTQITAGQGRNEDPSWAPDGKHIIFASNRTGTDQLYVARADGQNQHQLTRTGIENKSPAWSPSLP